MLRVGWNSKQIPEICPKWHPVCRFADSLALFHRPRLQIPYARTSGYASEDYAYSNELAFLQEIPDEANRFFFSSLNQPQRL